MSAWVIGNWKLNPATLQQALSLADNIAKQSQSLDIAPCQMVIAPSFLHMALVAQQLQSTNISIAGQDISSLNAQVGAYTGDTSAAQLKDMGATWVILGHSERRDYYAETNEVLLQKFQYAQQYDLGVIFCIGESKAEYEVGQTQDILKKQLDVIKGFLENQADRMSETVKTLQSKLIIAYEPVWAIGTGKIPTVEEVTQVHVYIREVLSEINTDLKALPILYGGSVKPENAQAFANSQEINGVLVGGAALDAESFMAIAQAFVASS